MSTIHYYLELSSQKYLLGSYELFSDTSSPDFPEFVEFCEDEVSVNVLKYLKVCPPFSGKDIFEESIESVLEQNELLRQDGVVEDLKRRGAYKEDNIGAIDFIKGAIQYSIALLGANLIEEHSNDELKYIVKVTYKDNSPYISGDKKTLHYLGFLNE